MPGRPDFRLQLSSKKVRQRKVFHDYMIVQITYIKIVSKMRHKTLGAYNRSTVCEGVKGVGSNCFGVLGLT